MKLQIGLYEKAMPNDWTMEQKLRCVKQNGFDFMEISIDETEEKLGRLTDPVAADDIRRAIDATGVPILTMCLSGHRKYPLGGTDPRCLEIMQGAIRLALKLGIRLIQLAGYDVYYTPSTPQTVRRFEENLRIAVDMAAASGVLLGFETMETDFMNTTAKAMQYVRKMQSPYLGVYPDIGNITNATPDYLQDLAAGAGHIFAAHLKETAPGKFRDMAFGAGHVDFDGCVDTLIRQGVRIFNCEFWYNPDYEPQEWVRRNKAYVDQVFAGYR